VKTLEASEEQCLR